ncbi:uncharacterized protein KD926_003772 [Aspergillus affinis]|uniref:uncharacterized protein n=1 Tax=Aspergillus affinis TaxID=1070780 RepID=UPI0022FDB871|nr:uncharacterized protein KD926_003772 [Aspergillus affinis]KAI9035299.1 hypothetical protein KD926_003772 [Aspergillus affinis]
MPPSGASTPQKRPRPNDLETRSLSTQLTERTRFDPSVQSSSGPSRQRSPARDLLNDLPLAIPPIHCTRPKEIPLPDTSLSLRRSLCENFGLKVIPVGLKDKIHSADPEGAMDIPDVAFDYADSRTPEQLEALWRDVVEIYQEAAECEEHGQDENAWGAGVIQPILKMGIRHHPILQVKNVQTQTISPSLLPRLPHKCRVSRKVDYAFAFSARNRRVKTTYDDFAIASPDPTISQTTDPFTKRIAIFSGVEVKQSNGGKVEALAQLSIWLAASLEKLLQISSLGERGNEHFTLLPTVGWTVIGHDWHLYIVFRGLFEGQDRIYIDGPIESVAASTRSYYGIFKLMDLVHRASKYAEEVYWPWMRDEILGPVNRPISATRHTRQG